MEKKKNTLPDSQNGPDIENANAFATDIGDITAANKTISSEMKRVP